MNLPKIAARVARPTAAVPATERRQAVATSDTVSLAIKKSALEVLSQQARGWYLEEAGDAEVRLDGDCLVVLDDDGRVVGRVRLVAERV